MPITASPQAPPKRGAKTSSAATGNLANAAPLSGKAKDRAEGLQGWLQVGQVACIAKGWNADAGAIGQHGEKLATETARVAENVEPVGKVLDILSMTGPYAALMGAALPFIAQILMNHKIIPESMMLEGVVPPAMLDAQVSAQLAQMQVEAIRAQQEAEQQLAEAKAALNGAGK
jgi:hypothetical protein